MRKIYYDSGNDYELNLNIQDYDVILKSLALSEDNRAKELLTKLPEIPKGLLKERTDAELKVKYEKMILGASNIFAEQFVKMVGPDKLKGMSEEEIAKAIQSQFGGTKT
jgi:hypothetical protein